MRLPKVVTRCNDCANFCEFTNEYKLKFGGDGNCLRLIMGGVMSEEEIAIFNKDDYCSRAVAKNAK